MAALIETTENPDKESSDVNKKEPSGDYGYSKTSKKI